MTLSAPMRVALVLASLVSLSVPLGSEPQGADGRGAGATTAAQAEAAAVARGRTLFAGQGASCHGAGGRGGPQSAIDLTQSPVVAGDGDGSGFTAFLKIGRPERQMPAFALPDADAAALAAFLRAPGAAPGRGRGRGPIAEVVGDAQTGESFFNGEGGCAACHSATGDLAGIGSRLEPAVIQGRILLPRGRGGYPPSFRSPPHPDDPQKTAVVRPARGAAVSGTLLWITDFNVTLLDAQGVRRTFARRGDEPNVEITDPVQAHLDRMRTLTDAQMHNLTAYLVTLK
jgi:mono/diheme cytochrome c family protein